MSYPSPLTRSKFWSTGRALAEPGIMWTYILAMILPISLKWKFSKPRVVGIAFRYFRNDNHNLGSLPSQRDALLVIVSILLTSNIDNKAMQYPDTEMYPTLWSKEPVLGIKNIDKLLLSHLLVRGRYILHTH